MSMKQLNEMFSEGELSNYLSSRIVDESKVGDFFKKTFNYLKGKIAQVGNFFVALFNGEPLSAITPITTQKAILTGTVKDKGVFVVGSKEDKKYSGAPTDGSAIIRAKGGNTLAWWRSMNIKESEIEEFANMNEDIQLRNEDSEIYPCDADELKDMIRERLTGADEAPLLIYGAPGVGKTEIVKAVLKEVQGKDARMLDFQLSLKEHDDFFLPSYEVNDKGEKTAAIDIPKSYLPVYKPSGDAKKDAAADAACGRGLIFLDELTQAKPQVQAVMLKLCQDRVLGEEYKLGSGWNFIAAANREADEVGGYDLNKALANRFFIVNYEPTVKTWRQWADKKAFMNQHIVDWLEDNQKYFYHQANPDSAMVATPRAWANACRALAVYAHTAEGEGFDLMDIPDNVIKRTLAGSVGVSVANAFMEYVKLARTINIEDLKMVFTDPDKAPLPAKSGSGYKTDLMYIICTQIISMINQMPDSDTFTNICKYVARLKNESACGKLMRAFCAKFPNANDEFGQGLGDMYVPGLQVLVAAYPDYDAAEDVLK